MVSVDINASFNSVVPSLATVKLSPYFSAAGVIEMAGDVDVKPSGLIVNPPIAPLLAVISPDMCALEAYRSPLFVTPNVSSAVMAQEFDPELPPMLVLVVSPVAERNKLSCVPMLVLSV